MSDNISPCQFELLWSDLHESNDDEVNGNESTSVVEMSFDEFEAQFGFDARIFDQEMSPVETELNNNEMTNGNPLNPESTTSSDNPLIYTPNMITDDDNTRSNSPSSHEPDATPTGNVFPVETPAEFIDLNIDNVYKFIEDQENTNTRRKTLSDLNKFARFLTTKGEERPIHELPVELLDEYLANFIIAIRKPDGSDYEPSSIRGMVGSVDRHLKRHRYPYLIMADATPFFTLTREALSAKTKCLKKQGQGNRPQEAEALTDNDITMMWEKSILGPDTPKSLLNTVWLNNCLHFGIRGTTEQYHLRWGDVQLRSNPGGEEYLELNERQTKTRTGQNITDIRKVAPRMFANPGNEKDPVAIYRLYAEKRPEGFNEPDSPFYLAPRTRPLTNSSINEIWYLRQKLGINKIGKMLKNMASDANIPTHRKITNHSARKHLVQKLRAANVNPTEIMAITGHKNVQSLVNYSNITNMQQQRCSHILSEVSHNNPPTTIADEQNSPSTVGPSVQTHAPCSSNGACFPALQSSQQVTLSKTHFSSQFYGATFNIQNFNVYNN